ncbi:MAG: pentapeptide repeat-containing protein, partial [Cyanobacteria bacterium P01_G01_bin.38]
MKAAELLKQYEAGRRDFRGESLRGQNFKGKDLSGSDFSGADIRSTNFTNANLTGANFAQAKAGLQRRWTAGLLVCSLLWSVVPGFLSVFFGYVVAFIFQIGNFGDQWVGWVAITVSMLLFFIIFIPALIVQYKHIVTVLGEGDAVFKVFGGAGTLSGLGAGLIVGLIASVVWQEDDSVVFAGPFIGMLVGSLLGIFLGWITVSLASIFIVTGILIGIFAVTVTVTVSLVGVFATAGVVVGTFVGILAVTSMFVSVYIGWRVFRRDKRNFWIWPTAVAFAAIGGTSFRGADLTDANFSQARLRSADFRRSWLIRTYWKNAKQLDRVRAGKTYLNSHKIQQLLITGCGQGQSFAHLFNLEGINLHYANLMTSDFTDSILAGGTLKGANLSNAVLKGTNLSHANLQGADLSNVNLLQTNLENVELQEASLREACFRKMDLRGINLSGADLSGADLCEADLSGVDLSGANLSGTNLIAIQGLGANFKRAIFTGACIEDWNINSATNLKGVVCDYVYLQRNHQERRPHGGSFQPGEFTQRFQQFLETVDLFFDDGVDWKAFLTSFQDLQSRYGDENLAVQGIERKSQNSFEIRLAVPPEVDKAEIERIAYKRYETERQLREAQFREQLAAKEGELMLYRQQADSLKNELLDAYRQQSRQSTPDLMEVVKILAARNPVINVESKAVADNQSQKYNLSNAQFAGGFAETVQGDQIGGTINNYGAKLDDITQLITSLRELAQSFPAEQKDDALMELDDIEADVNKP